MIKDPEIIKFTRDANGPHTQFVFGQPCDLETRKGKTAPHHLVPFPIALVSLLANWQNQLRPGCELRLISSPPSRLRSGLPEVAEG